MNQLSQDIKRDLTATVAHWRDTDLDEWAIPERGRPGHLELLLEPATEEELAALVGVLRRHRVATTTIAGGTGLVEAQRPFGVAISMRRFDEIGELTLADGTTVAPDALGDLATRTPAELRGAHLRVGAGVTIDRINETLAPAGLKLPIVMGSSGTATAGACAANGSAGANAVRYGTAADMAIHVRGVLGTGEIVAQDVPRRTPVVDPQRCRIRADRFSHGESLVGSQGALGLITEVTYQLHPVAQSQAFVLLPVADVATADRVRQQLQARFDRDHCALELFELLRADTLDRALDHAEQSLREGCGRAPYFAMATITSELPSSPSALGTEFVEEVVMHVMSEVRGADGELLFEDGAIDFDHDPRRMLAVREACPDMSRLLPMQAYDVVLPLARLDAFVHELEAIIASERPTFQLSIYGHGGVGALHVHVIAPDEATLAAERPDLDTAVLDLVARHGGSPWAEHGVGRKWGRAWRVRTPGDVVQEMVRIKHRCDPDNVIGSRLFGFDELLETAGPR